MTGRHIDLKTWPRAGQFHLFRGFAKPHFAVTSRVDVSHMMRRKGDGISPYRASLYAIGAGIHAVPELCMRFEGDQVTQHDAIALSMTVPRGNGSFGFGYLAWQDDFQAFDEAAQAEIQKVAENTDFVPDSADGNAVAYLSCLPWMDYTSYTNALPSPEDCIPRVSWGKIVRTGEGWDMAMTVEVHHALVDGLQVGSYFAEVQRRIDGV